MEQWGLPDLPHEVVYNILSRLPVKSLCRFKSISKPWLTLITDPHFVKSYLHQSMKSNTNHKLIVAPHYNWAQSSSQSSYSMDYQAPDPTLAELEMPWKSGVVEICGSFNGVLLLDIAYALGYDSINDDFKVVGFVTRTAARDVLSMPPFISDGPCTVHVFSSKLSSWKSIGDFDYPCCLCGPGSVLNGAPHWFAHGITDTGECCFRIVCFDVMEEKFKDVPTPIYEVESNLFKVGVLDGCLCAVDIRRPKSHFDVWMMKEYGVKESWTKLFVVPNVPGVLFYKYCALLCFTKDGGVVLRLELEASRPIKRKKSEESLKLAIYNPKQKTKRIRMPQDWMGFDVALYVESLVSPPRCNSTRRHC
ncbi:F-box protein CPR1-like [Rhododendron vialii]|uniref:F-box protein CPR1-like n=1 Tax=Rhododendron vialii TaxID=182163 RepID=UPI00265E6DC3|nr:F-box protein CPR1-like [Rhododendron vialii]